MTRALTVLGVALLVLLVLPVVGLLAGTGPAEVLHAWAAPTTLAALRVSVSTSLLALLIVLLLGTPLAWWLSRRPPHIALLTVIELPVVLPPAVLGVALLETFGRAGWLGPPLDAVGVSLPFSAAAVVLAQILVGAPLYVLTAAAAFRGVEDDLILVARTLGASPVRAWATIALPIALPGVVSGAALAWARGLGEFGATLVFAGNLPGRTQTLPLAIYEALEGDIGQARAIAVLLVGVAVALLVGVRMLGRARG